MLEVRKGLAHLHPVVRVSDVTTGLVTVGSSPAVRSQCIVDEIYSRGAGFNSWHPKKHRDVFKRHPLQSLAPGLTRLISSCGIRIPKVRALNLNCAQGNN